MLNAEPVRAAIEATASKENISHAKAWRKRARKLALEIAADYSHPVVRSVSFLLTSFWNKLYDGVAMHHFDTLRAVAPGPRSHLRAVPSQPRRLPAAVAISCYVNGVVVPHIAAGMNLNLPVIGPILRRGGAFFLRRSFKGNALYSAVFREYMASCSTRGVSIEYFIEGGRSRTGRLLAPRGGMLSMTLRSFPARTAPAGACSSRSTSATRRSWKATPTSASFPASRRRRNRCSACCAALGALRQHYGRVALNFGEPIVLTPLLDDGRAGLATRRRADPERQTRVAEPRGRHARRAHPRSTSTAPRDVNPINLLALALLATPKHAMAESRPARAARAVQGAADRAAVFRSRHDDRR